MLRQITSVYQRPGEAEKIWFTKENLDLFIWLSEQDEIIRFEFTYDKPNNEKSLIWSLESGLSHSGIDDGSRPGKHPSTPILLNDVPFNKNELANMLEEQRNVIPSKYLLVMKNLILN